MARLKRNEFRVETKIKPLSYDKRDEIPLNTFETFYVSRIDNIVCPCSVLSLFKDWKGRQMARVLVRDSVDGSGYHLYADEIGRNPEEAILHQWMLC